MAENWQNYLDEVDCVFLAIPTADDGYIAYQYIQTLTKLGIKVVTCEKGALANFFAELQSHIANIGYGATVGGGSGLLYQLQERTAGDSYLEELDGVFNGTLNYVYWMVAQGHTLDEAIAKAIEGGFAEPGNTDAIKIIMAEACSDVPMKVAIIANLGGLPLGSVLRAKDIQVTLTEDQVKTSLQHAAQMRFVVSFCRLANYKEERPEFIAFKHTIGEWIIVGRFVRVELNQLVTQLVRACPGVNNIVVTVEGRDGEIGTNFCGGPGAGAMPTSWAMVRDFMKLFGI
jgi:aspartokinase/homoserine dehydrogenase 1